MILIKAPIRGVDSQGSGAYGSSRSGGKLHKGVDIACYKGSRVLSLTKGVVTKIGLPYDPKEEKKKHLRYVEITRDDGLHVRYMYVEPVVKVGDKISMLDEIGTTQGLIDIYPGITDHFHLEMFYGSYSDRTYIDPTEFMEGGKA